MFHRRGSMLRLLVALCLSCGVPALSAEAQGVPTIRVGWTIPAEEGKYWMMRRPQEFPDLGKAYKIEWSQFQGTSVMSQALIAGALDCATQGVLPIAQGAAAGTLAVYIVAEHVGEKPGSFSVYWAVKEESPIRTVADLKGKTVGISIIGGGTQGPFDLMLKRNGLDPQKDIKLVEVSFSLSEDAIRSGRVDSSNMNQPFAARAEARGGIRKLFSLNEALPNIVHIVEACRKDFVDKNPELLRARYHQGAEARARQPGRDHERRLRDHQGAGVGARHLSAQAERFRARGRSSAELRRHPGDARRLLRHRDDPEEARCEGAQAPQYRGADRVILPRNKALSSS